MVRLAVADHFLVGRHAQALQPWQQDVGAQAAQVVVAIHGLGPFEMHGAGDVAATGGEFFLAGIFGARAGVEQHGVGALEVGENQCPAGGMAVGFVQPVAGGFGRCGDVAAEGMTLVGPAVQAAVENHGGFVAEYMQRPDETRGAATAFVVIGDDQRAPVDAQLRQQGGKDLVIGQQPGHRFFHLDDLAVFHVQGAGNMRLVVLLLLAQIDDHQLWLIAQGFEFVGLDEITVLAHGFRLMDSGCEDAVKAARISGSR